MRSCPWSTLNPLLSVGLRVKEDLQSEQVIHSTDDDIDGGGAARLSPQVVLEI